MSLLIFQGNLPRVSKSLKSAVAKAVAVTLAGITSLNALANDPQMHRSNTTTWPRAVPAEETDSIPVPAHFKADGANGAKGRLPGSLSRESGAPWWRLFHDPFLEKLEQEAVAGNQDLHQSIARVLQARAQARMAAADFYPAVSAPLGFTRERTTNTSPIASSRIIGPSLFPTAGAGSNQPASFKGQPLSNTFNGFQAQLALSYEADVFGRIRHIYGQARANWQASEADQRAVELSLTSQVAANYFTLRALDSQAAVLRRTLHLRADAVKLQKERLKGGVAGDIDLARAQFEQANTEADLADALQQRTELENALAVLCGQPASDFRIAESPLDQNPPPPIPAAIPAQLLTQRPDLIEAERHLAADSEGVKSAKAQFYPTFNVGANYGYESAESSQFLKDESHTWSITGGISIPLFEGGRNTARLNAAHAKKGEAFAAYQQTVLTAFNEAENALSALRQRAAQSEARGRAAKSALRVFDIAQKSYREGAINYFEVIDAQRFLLNAELSQVQTLNARYGATIDLIRAMGGGYEHSNVQPSPQASLMHSSHN